MKKPKTNTALWPTISNRPSARELLGLAGAALVMSTAPLQASDWTGTSSPDWNTPTNWSAGIVPTDNTFINTNTPNIATISADFIATPVDIFVGNNGNTARLDQTAGSASTGGGNWMFVGQDAGSSGTFNLADTTSAAGGISGYAQGSGSMSVGNGTGNGRLYVGRNGGNGTVNMNTSGSIDLTHHFIVGDGDNGIGVFNLESGTVNIAAEFWLGQGNATASGTMEMTGGSINSESWIAIGRDGGTGVANMSGGTWTKTGGGNFIIAASGPGTLNQTGGLIDVQAGITWIGENNNAPGVLSMSGTAEFSSPEFFVGVNAGTSATLNLDGGTIRTSSLHGGDGTTVVDFNGTQFIGTGNGNQFIDNIDTATIETGGLKVDTAGFNLSGDSNITGTGGVTKDGAGNLSLLGDNGYSGANAVNGGKLTFAAAGLTVGDITIADGAGLGVVTPVIDDTLTTANLSFLGTATTLDFGFGDVTTLNPENPALNASTNLNINGTVTVNISGEKFAVGTFPILTYGGKTGSGTFAIGTLPVGVQADLVDNGTDTLSLDVTVSVLPRWEGEISNEWDTATLNWFDEISVMASVYGPNEPAFFNDDATGAVSPFDVNLDVTVTPELVSFDNSANPFTLNSAGGTGKISDATGTTGPTNLKKGGNESLTITNLANDYTGVTTLEGGITSVDSLTNGGTASSIGAATSDPANLLLAGGTLDYTGASTTIDRGFTITGGGSGLSMANDLTVSGEIATTGGNLTKTGAGTLTLDNPGAISIGTGFPSLAANEGTTVMNGSGTQVTTITGDLWVASEQDVQADFTLIDAELTVGNFIAISRGNGGSGLTSTFTVTNSTVTTGNISTGFDADLPANDVTTIINLIDSNWTTNGQTLLSERANSKTTFTLSGNSVYECDRFQIALGVDSTADVIVEGNASISKVGGAWTSIGNSENGVGTMTIRDNGSVSSAAGDMNISDVGTSQGTLNIQDSGSFSVITGTTFVGKNGGTMGTINQSGGATSYGGNVSVGFVQGSNGFVNVTGGVFDVNVTNPEDRLIVGDQGSGTLTVSGTGSVMANGAGTVVGEDGTGAGIVNLNTGGLLITPLLQQGGGSSNLAFDGGTIRASAGNGDFINVDVALVGAGGGTIDSNGFDITVAQNFSGSGSLNKTGAGTLAMNGDSILSGTTTVIAGALGGTGSVAGPLQVNLGTTIAPGNSAGEFTAGATTINGNYAFEIDGAIGDSLTVNGNLTLGAASTLNITQLNPASATAYIVASYSGTLTGTFAGGITGIPTDYVIDYAYNGTSIAIVNTAASAYDLWIAGPSGYFPGETDPSIIGSDADPDTDGQSNKVEFALGGVPNDGGNNAKVYSLQTDRLLVTVAVLSGTPAFSAGPAPTATIDACTYTVEGSDDLSTFASAVAVAPVDDSGLPMAPVGYEYRTFSLTSSIGLMTKGFMRVDITP